MKKKVLPFIIILLVFITGTSAYAADSTDQTVRVGYFDLGSYYTVKEDGSIESYDAAYLKEIAGYTGYTFEYVDCVTWDEAIKMLEAHEIDLVGTMQWTEEREEKYQVCDASYGYSVAELAALESSGYIYEDYAAMDGAEVGCIGGYVIKKQLTDFMQEKGLSFTIHTYATQTELDDALDNGEIDLVAANAHAVHSEWQVVEKFAYAPYYFASWKGNSEVTDAISEAIIKIHVYQSDFSDSLIKAYFPQLVSSPYTKEELECIAKKENYVVCFDGNTAPLVWYDEAEASMKGVLVEVCHELTKQSGLNLEVQKRAAEPVPENNYMITYRTLYYNSEKRVEETGVTNAILDQEFEMYHKIGEDYQEGGAYQIAIVRNRDGLRDYLEENYPESTLVECDSPAECMKQLSNGTVQLSFLNSNVAEHIIITDSLDQISAIPMTNKIFGIALQFHGSEADLLAGIVNKSLQMVDQNKINGTLISYALTTAPDMTIEYLVKQHTGLMLVLSGILVLILIAFSVLLTYVKVMQREKNRVEAANQARTDFFSRMSHDMRTPMNGILGMARLSHDETDAEKLKENIGKIEDSGEYMLSLINDTLDLQKLESGKMKFHMQTVEADPYFKGILEMAEASAKQKELTFSMELAGVTEHSYLKLDPIRVKQILLNLTSNAIKFTPTGGKVCARIERIAKGSEAEMETYRFFVQDSGVGMSSEFMEKQLFQAYSQEHNRISDQYAGSGLGLAITKNIVELLNGHISVKSELGEGTTFTVELEFLSVDSKKAMDHIKTKEKETAQIKTTLKGIHVLLAEDHPLNAEIVIRLLEKAGCTVNWSENGAQAVEQFDNSETEEFDVILMDIRMPVMDGITAATKIRELERSDAKKIPIIALSANAYDEDVKACLAAGMNAHLAKPIDPATLYEVITHEVY